MIITKPTYETSQLVPIEFCRANFAANRKLLWVYLAFRQSGIGSAGWTTDAVQFLMDRGVASSTASRYLLKMEKLGWIHRQNGAVQVKSVHKLTATGNRYAISIQSNWLNSYKQFELFIFSTLLLSKFQADFKAQNRRKAVSLDKERDESYRSYDLHSALTTETVSAKYMGVSQPTFHRLKKSAANAGLLRSKGKICKKISFVSKEDALRYLEVNSKSGRFQKINGVYYIVVGSTISINRILGVNKYSRFKSIR